jgi:toxin ParE1/3/4
MRIRWTPAAADDVQSIFDHLSETNPNLARSTIIEIRKAVRSLKRLPHRGRPGREPGTRELLHIRLPHIVAYRVKEDAVEVVRIWHPAQDRS